VFILVLAIGFVTGGLSNITSGGAGLVTVFVLSKYAGVTPQESIGTVVAASVVFVSMGAAEFYRKDAVDRQLAITVGISGVVGAYASAVVALAIKGDTLKSALGIFTLFLAAYGAYDLLRRRRKGEDKSASEEFPSVDFIEWSGRWRGWRPGAVAVQVLFGFATGVATGLFGVGGGAITLAAFLFLFSLPVRIVLGTSLVVSALRYAAASYPYVSSGSVSLIFFVVLAVSGAAGSIAGARILTGRKTNDTYLRLLLLALFLFIGVEFLI
jgi:uncharacterized membrane protein YfcA